MDFLKEKLGDKYDEFAELIGDMKLKIDDGEHMIPKSRFDEVNTKYQDLKVKLEEREAKKMTEEEKLQAALEEAEEVKKDYQREIAKMGAMKIFVNAGLEEEQYETLLDTIVSEDAEKTAELAENLVGVISSKQTEAEKRVKADLIKKTPTPPEGEGNEEKSSIGEKFAKQMNNQNNSQKTVWD